MTQRTPQDRPERLAKAEDLKLADLPRPLGNTPTGCHLDRELRGNSVHSGLKEALARHRRSRTPRTRPREVDVHILSGDTHKINLASVGPDEWYRELGESFHDLVDRRLVHL